MGAAELRLFLSFCFLFKILQGCVYVKCLSPEYAGKAFKALHGSWFDGKKFEYYKHFEKINYGLLLNSTRF